MDGIYKFTRLEHTYILFKGTLEKSSINIYLLDKPILSHYNGEKLFLPLRV